MHTSIESSAIRTDSTHKDISPRIKRNIRSISEAHLVARPLNYVLEVLEYLIEQSELHEAALVEKTVKIVSETFRQRANKSKDDQLFYRERILSVLEGSWQMADHKGRQNLLCSRIEPLILNSFIERVDKDELFIALTNFLLPKNFRFDFDKICILAIFKDRLEAFQRSTVIDSQEAGTAYGQMLLEIHTMLLKYDLKAMNLEFTPPDDFKELLQNAFLKWFDNVINLGDSEQLDKQIEAAVALSRFTVLSLDENASSKLLDTRMIELALKNNISSFSKKRADALALLFELLDYRHINFFDLDKDPLYQNMTDSFIRYCFSREQSEDPDWANILDVPLCRAILRPYLYSSSSMIKEILDKSTVKNCKESIFLHKISNAKDSSSEYSLFDLKCYKQLRTIFQYQLRNLLYNSDLNVGLIDEFDTFYRTAILGAEEVVPAYGRMLLRMHAVVLNEPKVSEIKICIAAKKNFQNAFLKWFDNVINLGDSVQIDEQVEAAVALSQFSIQSLDKEDTNTFLEMSTKMIDFALKNNISAFSKRRADALADLFELLDNQHVNFSKLHKDPTCMNMRDSFIRYCFSAEQSDDPDWKNILDERLWRAILRPYLFSSFSTVKEITAEHLKLLKDNHDHRLFAVFPKFENTLLDYDLLKFLSNKNDLYIQLFFDSMIIHEKDLKELRKAEAYKYAHGTDSLNTKSILELGLLPGERIKNNLSAIKTSKLRHIYFDHTPDLIIAKRYIKGLVLMFSEETLMEHQLKMDLPFTRVYLRPMKSLVPDLYVFVGVSGYKTLLKLIGEGIIEPSHMGKIRLVTC